MRTIPRVEPVSARLAATLAECRWNDLPAAVVADAKRAILDWLGSALAGALEPPARMAQRVVASLGVSEDATAFAAGRASAAGAALANGVAAHILEVDDVHTGSTLHAGAPVISAALAVAEREHADGRAFVLAVVMGYDAALRVGEAVNPSHYRFWHPTGTAATFGAAAAAGSLLGLSPRRMLDALGSAGTQAAGLWEFNADGTMSKHLHPGKAAFNGILAADLAREGFTGAGRILEGDRGFFRAMSAGSDATRITDGLGERWKVSENWFKVYACCGHTHTAIDIARALRSEQRWTGRARLDEISEIHIETYGPGYGVVKEQRPRSAYEAQFSLAYCVAATLLEGGVPLHGFSHHDFTADGPATPDVAALLGRTRVTVADDLTARYPRAWPARLTITLTNGTVLRGTSDHPLGTPDNPVSTDQLETKFRQLVTPRWDESVANRALDAVRSIESCDDVAVLFRDIASRPVGATA